MERNIYMKEWQAGRARTYHLQQDLLLTKSVLNDMSGYNFRVAEMPKSVLNYIDKKIRDFIWGGKQKMSNKFGTDHLPYQARGLGIWACIISHEQYKSISTQKKQKKTHRNPRKIHGLPGCQISCIFL